MNKILFALLFTSVSFCSTQEASAARSRKPQMQKEESGRHKARTPNMLEVEKIRKNRSEDRKTESNFRAIMAECILDRDAREAKERSEKKRPDTLKLRESLKFPVSGETQQGKTRRNIF